LSIGPTAILVTTRPSISRVSGGPPTRTSPVYVTVKTYTERPWRPRPRRRVVPDEITLFESLGLAAEDLAAASYLYEKATRLGAGTVADF